MKPHVLVLAILWLPAPAAAAVPTVDSCEEAQYVDASAPDASRDLVWDFSTAGDARRCLKIRAGQSIRFVGNFAMHPLQNDEGTRPNPIEAHASGLVTFTTPGVFGYRCEYHFEMRGAIQVVAATAVPASSARAFALAAALALVFWRFVRRRNSAPLRP